MKDFLKYTLATITGIVIVGTVTVFFCILAILCFAISGSSDNTVTIKDNSVLVVNLSGDIVEHVNDNITISNEISIVSDPYALQNFHAIRYISWMGTNWKVSSVEVRYPRLILSIGDEYHGPTA